MKILFVNVSEKNNDVKCYDGKIHSKLKYDDYLDRKNKFYKYPDSLMVEYVGDDIESDHKKHIKKLDEIIKLTDGKLDPYTKNIGKISYKYFKSFLKSEHIPRTIVDYEKNYLINSGGGVRIGVPTEDKLIYKYDINSFYPSILSSKSFKIPTTEGDQLHITQDEMNNKKFCEYGIYNCKITGEIDDRLFTILKSNMYTHYEINLAKQLNYNIEILGPALVWNKDELQSSAEIFQTFNNNLWAIKKKNKLIKPFINSLWGYLAKNKKKKTKRYTFDDIPDDAYDIEQIDENLFKCTTNKGIEFNTTFARIKPFLLGLARNKMHRWIKKIGQDKILFAHTDSLFSTIPLSCKSFIHVSDEPGHWKYEGKYIASVFNKNRYSLKGV